MSLRLKIGIFGGLLWISAIAILIPLPQRTISEYMGSYETNVESIQKLQKDLAAANGAQADLATPTTPSVVRGIWLRWIAKLILVIAGVSAAGMAYVGLPFWKSGVIATSLFYLAGWMLPFLRGSDSLFSTFIDYGHTMLSSERLWIKTVFLHQDIALPLLHILILILVLNTILSKKQKVA